MNKLYILPYIFIWLFFGYETYSMYSFISLHNQPVLNSPFGILMITLNPVFTGGFYYYHLYEVHKIQIFPIGDWFFALSPIMAAIVFFQLSFLFIILFAKIRKTENSFIIFAVVIALQYILFFDFVTSHKWTLFFYFFTMATNIAFMNMFLTLLNKKFPVWIWLPWLILSGYVTYHMHPDSAHEEIQLIKLLGGLHFVTLLSGIVVYIYDEVYPQKWYTIKSLRLRRLFIFTSLSIIIIPAVSYLIPLYVNVTASVYHNVAFYVPAIFPMMIMIFSLHSGFIFFEKPVQTWYLRLVYFLFYIFLYGLIVGFEGLFVFTNSGVIWIHILSVLAFIFIFDALRLLSEISIKYYINYRKFIFDEHITDIFQYIRTPFQFEEGMDRFLQMTEAGSQSSKVTLLLSKNLFGSWLGEKNNVRLVDDEDPVWDIHKKYWFQEKLVITLADKGLAGLYLQKYAGVIFIFLNYFKGAIVLGEKSNSTPYLSEDIKYIRDLVRQIEPIMENFKLLVDNIETKKFERELDVVSQVQRKMGQPVRKNKNIHIYLYNQPSRVVTGDYLEVFYLSRNKYLLLLGDVSGHGLASAYFMGMVRSLIDGLVHSKHYSLPQIFKLINSVLCDKQGSSTFMTLSAIEISIIKTETGHCVRLDYVNAGQHNPVIYLREKDSFIDLPGNQTVLGVIDTDYEAHTKIFSENLRLILTSDGAFEIFNADGEILGEQRFIKWLGESIHLSAEDQKTFLMQNIQQYSANSSAFDDISILIADVTLQDYSSN